MDTDLTAESNWLDQVPAPRWEEFEPAAEAGKQILERLAGDRSTLRTLLFTAPDRCAGEAMGTRSADSGMIRLYDDSARGLSVFIHVGTGDRPARRTVSTDAVVKVLTGHVEHTWFRGDEVGYVTREQAPGLFAIRSGVEHSLSWKQGTVSLILGRSFPDWATETDSPLDSEGHRELCCDIDSLGVV